jgi:acyl-coenzyme A thioesterase PaaI-like protein
MTETTPSPRRRSRRWLIRWMNLFPPYVGAGIRVRPNADLSAFDVRMKLRWWNRNYVGTHFGGSLYSLCDPFFMLILFEALGPGYVVWDKAATIRFRRPGRGTVHARFEIGPEQVAEIRAAADRDGKVEPTFVAEVRDDEGQVIAEVEKLLYVRRKAPEAP